jgi:hypothetical protein
MEKAALATVTRTKGSNARMVLGSGLTHRLGMTATTNSTNIGYTESGRTNVLPPMPAGKYGKLVMGKQTRNSAQAIFWR